MTTKPDDNDERSFDSVLTFLPGDYSGGTGKAADGFEFRLRLPEHFGNVDGAGFDTTEVPGGGYLVKIEDGADHILMEDWQAGRDDRFHLVVIYRPYNQRTRQKLSVFANGEVVSTQEFRAGDVLSRSVDADTLAFEVESPDTKVAPWDDQKTEGHS